ncbi:enoyl-CoA hydratase/isomerase family protein [Streptomyces sp. NBC_00893]|uniref:enoyl-CoA hydratase/isomerase family protein n=1 Tax=Streptomyces sp. NBC_00893 TaxID=2975862 RepID=UPI002253A037|nr:enoyl-CoA hydratase-related protein [Streptomyces sp. NBC_00893]MCX4852195.1 enoyl-CoA hydratase-related protein [Streptomyces sp. NBC_00893]
MTLGFRQAVLLRDSMRAVALPRLDELALHFAAETAATISPVLAGLAEWDRERLAEVDAERKGQSYRSADPQWHFRTALETARWKDGRILRAMAAVGSGLSTAEGFAEEGASFGVTPARLGIVYAASSTRRLVALIGPAAAKHLLFSGELIDTARALRTGLVDEVLPAGELDKRVGSYVRTLAARSRLTQAAAKEFATGREDRDAYWAEQARRSGDTTEGVAAFLERRAPRFTWTTGS